MYFKSSVFLVVVLNLIVTIKCKNSASTEEGKLIFAHIVSINILPEILFKCSNLILYFSAL